MEDKRFTAHCVCALDVESGHVDILLRGLRAPDEATARALIHRHFPHYKIVRIEEHKK